MSHLVSEISVHLALLLASEKSILLVFLLLGNHVWATALCFSFLAFFSAIFCVFDVSPFLLFSSCIIFCHISHESLDTSRVSPRHQSVKSILLVIFFFFFLSHKPSSSSPYIPFQSDPREARVFTTHLCPVSFPTRHYTPFPDPIPFFPSKCVWCQPGPANAQHPPPLISPCPFPCLPIYPTYPIFPHSCLICLNLPNLQRPLCYLNCPVISYPPSAWFGLV
ncbi:hypothetical protein VTN02DRAFT_3502 [Thermoascus thermophilus]